MLSKRNLLALLSKLTMGGSARTIVTDTPEGHLFVQVESDEAHYGDRGYGPGPMLPATEGWIERYE